MRIRSNSVRRVWGHAVMAAARILARAEALLARKKRSKSREVVALRREVARLEAENGLLRARLRKIPGRNRPRYSAWQRLGILWHRSRYRPSLRKTAKLFVLGKGTLRRWLDDLDRAKKRVVGARRAVNRLPDLVREIAALLRLDQQAWGTRRISQVLARLGLNVSRTSVQRIVRQKPRRRPPTSVGAKPRKRSPGIRPKRPHYVWFIDLTTVKTCFGFRSFRVAAIIDAFSRVLVAIKAFADEPSAREIVHLVRRGIDSAGEAPCCVARPGDHLVAPELSAAHPGRSRNGASPAHLAAYGRLPHSSDDELGKMTWGKELRSHGALNQIASERRVIVRATWARVGAVPWGTQREPGSMPLGAQRNTPAHVITDQGNQFTAKRFRGYLRRCGVRQRFGAIRSFLSVAVIERFWRSMKEDLRGALRHLVGVRSVDVALGAWARWYRMERPHQGLGGRTPDEVSRARPSRRRRRIDGDWWRLERRDLDGQQHLPVYRLRRAG